MKSEKPKNRCVLITATIVPNSNFVVVQDEKLRRSEYINALRYYAETLDDPIFFLENSQYDFTSDQAFTDLLNKYSIQLMKFPPSEHYAQGKGYQEFEMLDKALEKLSGEYASFIKLTGRYIIRNIVELLDDFTGDMVIEKHRVPKVALTGFFYSSVDFYMNYLFGAYKKADDSKGMMIENVIYQELTHLEEERRVKLFSSSPKIEGVSGSYGRELKRNPVKMQIRSIERKILRVFGLNEFLIEY